jgi:hypothetical protein
MLNTHQQVEFLIAGLHANGATVPALANDPVDTFAHAAYHDDVSKLQEEDTTGHDFVDAAVGRWARTGDVKFIGELVRIAKHRDGSTARLGESLYAMEVLNTAVIADHEFKAILRNFGYDTDKPTHGDFPNGLTADDFSAPAPESDQGALQTLDADAHVGQVTAVDRMNSFALSVNCRGESDGVVVLEFYGVEGLPNVQSGVRIGISVAAELQEELGQLIDELTLPAAEGYEWIDGEDGMSSILRAEGRKTSALFTDKTKFPGTRDTREIGTVDHDDEGSSDGSAPFVSMFGNEELARSADLTSAKFTLAQHVREYVAAQTAA